jgi:hypothetical protein
VLQSQPNSFTFAVGADARLKRFVHNTACVDGTQAFSETIDYCFERAIHAHRKTKNQF